MQEQLAVTLSPERVSGKPGGAAAQVNAVIQNLTQVVDSYVLEVTGLDPDWYKLPARNLTLFPGEQKSVNILFQPPANFETLAGRYDYSVGVRSTVVNSRTAQAAGVLFVNLDEAINLRLQRESARGQEGKFQATVSNRSKSPQLLALEATDPDGLLDFTFDPPTPQIPAGGSQMVEIQVRLAAGQALSAERAFRFALGGQTLDGRYKANTVDAQFVYVPVAIHMELQPARDKGVEGHYNLNVANPGIGPVGIQLSATDPDQTLDVTFQQRTMVLQPGTSAILPLTVRLKAGRKPELKAYPFTVSVRASGGAPNTEIGPPVTGELLYAPAVVFEMALEGGGVKNTQADFVVKLTNPSMIGLRLSLRAQDPQQVLGVFFGTQVDQLQLDPGGALEVQLLVQLKVAPPAQQTTYPFAIIAHAIPDDGSSETEKTVNGQFVYGGPGTAQPMLALDLLPPQARGSTGRFQVRLTSGVDTALQVVLRGRDDGGQLRYEFAPGRLQLAPGAAEAVDLTVSAKSAQDLDGQKNFPFEVISWVPGVGTAGSAARTGTWIYVPAGPAAADLTLRLEPTQVIGDTGQFAVTLANPGNATMVVVLRASDEADALEFLFQTPRLELGPREIRELTLIVRGRDGAALPGPYRYPFEVAGWVPGTAASDAGVGRGELIVLEPLKTSGIFLPWQRLAMAALLVLWMALPFVLDRVLRRGPYADFLQLLYQVGLPLLAAPILAIATQGTRSPSEVKGWRAVLIGWLSFGSILVFAVQTGVEAVRPEWQPFVNLVMLPALLIVLVI